MTDEGVIFALLNEIGIIGQLSRAMMEAELPDGLILPHFSVLNHLIRVRDGQTPLVLANAFQVPKTTMTHTLAGLEKHGFVETRPNPKDARSKCVWLTDSGRAFRDQSIASLAPHIRTLLTEVAIDDARAALPFLSRLRETLDDMRDPD